MRPPPRLLAGLAFAALLAPLAVAPIANNDIWLHLRTGELTLSSWSVPRVELFTFTRAGTPIVPHEWLAQVVFEILHRLGGTAALSLAYAALVGIVLWLVHRAAARAIGREQAGGTSGLTGPAAALTTLGCFVMMLSFLSIRPHLFSFLCAAAAMTILPRLEAPGRGAARAAAALLGLQCVWANLHGAFVVGIALAAIHVAALCARRRRISPLLLLPAGLAAVSCLNPGGWRLYELVGRFSDPVFRRVIVEWRSPFDPAFMATPAFWVAIAWVALAFAGGLRSAWEERDHAPLGTLVLMGTLAATSRRHISLLAILTAPAAGRGLALAGSSLLKRVPGGHAARRAAGWAAFMAVGAVAAVGGTLLAARFTDPAGTPRPGLVAANIPVEALEVMRAESVRGRVFTSLGLGSYITWRGWPDLLTSVDSRLEVFGGDFLEEHLAAAGDPERFGRFEAAHPFDLALLPWRLPSVRGALAAMKTDPDWALVYFDDVVMLYARRTREHADLIARRELKLLDPIRFMSRGDAAPGIDPAAMAIEARRAAGDPPVLAGRPPVNTVALRLAERFSPGH